LPLQYQSNQINQINVQLTAATEKSDVNDAFDSTA